MIKRTVQLGAVLALGWLVQACAEDDGEGATQASGDSDGACVAGQEGCPCAQGNACAVGLTCVSNACIDPGGISGGTSGGTSDGTTTAGSASGGSTSTGGASGGSTSGSSTSTSGNSTAGDPTCATNEQCASDEVCYQSLCTWIGLLYFEVTVHDFSPPDCSDGWGTAEIYYDFYQGDTYISSSATSSCPGTWADESVFYDPLQSFALQFWELDAFDDDLITSLCWGGDPCEPIPYEILREGSWSGLDSEATYYLALSFEPV